jgi:hypothetical protein
MPGATIKVLARQPCQGPVSLQVASSKHTVSLDLTHRVFVKIAGETPTPGNPVAPAKKKKENRQDTKKVKNHQGDAEE